METHFKTPALDEALKDLAADAKDTDHEREIVADVVTVVTALGRGASCAERPSTLSDRPGNLSVNCGGVCTKEVKLCQVIEEDRQAACTVPDVEGKDIYVRDRPQPVALQPMRVF